MLFLYILAQEAPVKQASKDIVDILQILVIPLLLVTIPAFFTRSRKTDKASQENKQSIKKEAETLVDMMETLLMNFGELRGDFKDLNRGQEEIRDSLDEHITNDEDFARATDERLKHIEEALTS